MQTLHYISLGILILGGNIGLPVVLITILLSSKVTPRTPTLVNFLVCWIVWSIAFLLL